MWYVVFTMYYILVLGNMCYILILMILIKSRDYVVMQFTQILNDGYLKVKFQLPVIN